ncbi:MAG: hypothetical protein M3Y87_15950 [Myxococcota bacterium]|nr:hypothetical protein [Myxococcota bacterium]
MRGAPISILGLIALCLSCEVSRVARETATLPDGSPMAGRLEVAGGESSPSISAQIPWPNPSSLWGWGAVRLWGSPREDELRVHAIVDAPAGARRWGAMCEVRVRIDEREVAMRASYVGRAMSRGQYDAVRIDLPIEELRAISRAQRVEGEVCGDRFEIGAEQRETVGRFVERFDALSVPAPSLRGTPPAVGPDVFVPGQDEEIWPTPA